MRIHRITSRSNRKGMTLVELTAIIAVFTLLAVFVAPRWIRVVRNSKAAVCRSNIAIINAAASAYLSETREPAPSLASLVDSGYLEGIPECACGGDYAFNGYYVDNLRNHTR
jgi:type II secretory pathway pseudopilin PulG